MLIENGILQRLSSGQAEARLMKMPRTGNGRRENYAAMPMPRMTNTYMLAGDKDPEEIIASVKKRPLCGQFRRRPGGHHQRQVRVLGLRSLHDRRRQGHYPVKGATLIGNGPEVLTCVTQVGNE